MLGGTILDSLLEVHVGQLLRQKQVGLIVYKDGRLFLEGTPVENVTVKHWNRKLAWVA